MSDELGWKESIPEQLRDAPFFAKANSLDEALEGIKNSAQWQGNSIRIPGPDASPDQIKEFRKKAAERIDGLMEVPVADDPDSYKSVLRKLGMPEKADDYGDLEGKTNAEIRQLAHEAGLTVQQYKQIFGKLAETTEQQAVQAQRQHKEQMESLKEDWGRAYDKRVAAVKNVAEEFGFPADVVEKISAGEMRADFYQALYRIAEKVQPPGAVSANNGKQELMELSPQEIQQQIVEINRNPDFMDRMSPNHKYLVEKKVKLMTLLHPS